MLAKLAIIYLQHNRAFEQDFDDLGFELPLNSAAFCQQIDNANHLTIHLTDSNMDKINKLQHKLYATDESKYSQCSVNVMRCGKVMSKVFLTEYTKYIATQFTEQNTIHVKDYNSKTTFQTFSSDQASMRIYSQRPVCK